MCDVYLCVCGQLSIEQVNIYLSVTSFPGWATVARSEKAAGLDMPLAYLLWSEQRGYLQAS
jgi:hypothetical protein